MLADGTMFEGEAIGAEPADGVRPGEVVFNTALSGYQEIVTDPSYAGQIITFTYPHIGNYGVNRDDDESRAAVLPRRDRARPRPPPEQLARDRRPRRVPRRAGDPRHHRHRHPPARPATSASTARSRARSAPTRPRCAPRAARARRHRGHRPRRRGDRRQPYAVGDADAPFSVVAYDFGIKRTILRHLVGAGCHVEVVPASTTAGRRARARARRRVPLERSRRPGRGRAARSTPVARLCRQGPGVRDLPRPPDPGARARRPDAQAAVRAPRREPPGAPRGDRAGRDHEPEPQLRGRGRRARRRRGHAREPQRRRRRGLPGAPAAARSACSTTPRPVPGRTTPRTCSPSSRPDVRRLGRGR